MTIDLRLGRWQDVLADVLDGSVRLLLTSPPYDDARTYEGTCGPVDFGELAAFALRVLCPGGTLAMVLDGPVRDGEQSATPYRVAVEWSALPGWRFSQMLAYQRNGLPGEYRGRFRKDHEPLLVFVRDGDGRVCEKDRLAEPANCVLGSGSARTSDGRMRQGGWGARPTARNIRHRGSVWSYGSVGHGHDPSCNTGHPATFAERFARDAVAVWSNPGDLVCDPFGGSGTVARACLDSGRKFVGAELVEKYHAIAERRLAQRSLSEVRERFVLVE